MIETHFRKLENMYHGAPINVYFKPKLIVGHGNTELKIDVKPDFLHAARSLHGCVYFKALDDAAYFAVSSLVEEVFILTANFTLYFLKPISSGTIIAKGNVVYESKSNFIAEAVIYDQNGEQISRGGGSFLKSKIPLNKDIGYY